MGAERWPRHISILTQKKERPGRPKKQWMKGVVAGTKSEGRKMERLNLWKKLFLQQHINLCLKRKNIYKHYNPEINF